MGQGQNGAHTRASLSRRLLWIGVPLLLVTSLVPWGRDLVARRRVARELALAAAGDRLFTRLGCDTCHGEAASSQGPALSGLFGSEVQLAGGGTVIADEAYLRESILRPSAKVVAGYDSIMPMYGGQIDEETMRLLIAYMRSLAGGRTASEGG